MLADRYRVIAVDLRGHGRSEVGSDGLGLPRLATDVATLLRELDLHDAVLVGHSMGGMTVMRFCGDHPDVLDERVAGIALVATAAYGTVPPLLAGASRRLLARGADQVASGRELPAQTLLTRRAVRMVFGDKPSARAIDIVTEMTGSIGDANLIGSIQGIVEHDARDALRATRTPSLVVVGTRDTLTPVPLSRRMARLMPGCEFVVLPRAGHQLMQERPNELADLLDAMVARIEGSAASVAEAVAVDGGPVSPAQVEPAAESA
jgi:pimeloyl-ACP methyl ester carboxylesterase